MNVENEHADDHRRENEHALSLDDVITTQPELGPSIPDGGFGWVVFIGTLFFQVSQLNFATGNFSTYDKSNMVVFLSSDNKSESSRSVFQALVPCLIVNFGIFLAFSKLNGTAEDKNIFLWDDKFLYVPLFFSFSKCFFGKNYTCASMSTNHFFLLRPFVKTIQSSSIISQNVICFFFSLLNWFNICGSGIVVKHIVSIFL